MDIRAVLIENTACELKQIFLACDKIILAQAREIRVRLGLPLSVKTFDGEYFIAADGKATNDANKSYRPTSQDITQIVERVSKFSLYAYDSDIKNGFVTIPGGHRLGLSGKMTIENGKIKTIKYISGLNIRVAREVKGAADAIMPHLTGALGQINSTIFVSPPGCGKTTVLRDVVRQLSCAGKNVAVIDERSEIAGCFMGAAQNDLGPRVDVLDGAPKEAGMMMALRALSPDVIAVDEIGSEKETQAVRYMAQSGVAVLCSVHASGVEDLVLQPALAGLSAMKIFKRYVVLSDKPTPGSVVGIYNEELCKMGYGA